MKNMNRNKKILSVLAILIVVAGIIMTATKGFNFDLKYQKTQKVELVLNQEFKNSEVKEIAKEVFENQPIMIEKVEVFEDTVAITTTKITEEQKANLITKINEKYGTQLNQEATKIIDVAHTKGLDLIKPYILPFAIATLAILVYMGARYYKLGIVKTTLKVLAILAIIQVELFSVIALTRIPVGRLTIPMVIIVYLFTLLGITNNLEKCNVRKKEEMEKKQ